MSRRRRRPHRPSDHPGELALAAMVDMMINILMFLLTLYGTDPIAVQPTADLDVPTSTTRRPVQYAPDLRVTTREIILDGEIILALGPGPSLPPRALEDGVLPALRARLAEAAVAARSTAETDAEPLRIDVQCDRRMPWEVLGPVLHTAGVAGFPAYRFIVRSVPD
jgi:hypothetical protein